MHHVWAILFMVALPATNGILKKMKLIEDWKSIDFDFPSPRLRQEALSRQEFVPGNAVPIDVDVQYRVKGAESRVFITFPRFQNGIPITLGTRSVKKSIDSSRLIEPYPDYSWHQNVRQDCNNKILSAFRIAIDECQRLWVVDTGKLGLAESPQVCPPKILVFNLNTNRLIHRHEIPRRNYNELSFFITPIIDVQSGSTPENCGNSRAYIADVAGFSLLVYDAATDSSWLVRNKLFFPFPTFGTHKISGESFELMDGIMGMSLSPKRINRSLYFHALASETENIVSLNVLGNRTAFETDANANPASFQVLGPRGSQSAASAMDANGNLYFGMNAINAIACWDTTKVPLTRATVRTLVKDDVKLQFASGMKVIRNTDGEEELWVVTNRFQKVLAGTMNTNEMNFRIQAQRTSELLTAGKCS